MFFFGLIRLLPAIPFFGMRAGSGAPLRPDLVPFLLPSHGRGEHKSKQQVNHGSKIRILIEELFPKGGNRKSEDQKSKSETLTLIDAGITKIKFGKYELD